MRILFGIQGTGNGHLGRSFALIQELQRFASVDVLISGTDNELSAPIQVAYRFNGMGFVFGNKGGIDIVKTWQQWNFRQLKRDLASIPIRSYDAVVSDFEPLSLYAAKQAGIPTLGISNQYSYFHPAFDRGRYWDPLGSAVLRHYAPARNRLAYFYESFAPEIYPPYISPALRQLRTDDEGFILVYLPACHHTYIESVTRLFPFHRWKVFSKRLKEPYHTDNASFYPVEAAAFQQALANCSGLVCAAGFGTTSEALHLGKKMLVVPMKGQLEQRFNARWLAGKGVCVLPAFHADQARQIRYWLEDGKALRMAFPDRMPQLAMHIAGLLEPGAVKGLVPNQNPVFPG